jgi:hypothetical protein
MLGLPRFGLSGHNHLERFRDNKIHNAYRTKPKNSPNPPHFKRHK